MWLTNWHEGFQNITCYYTGVGQLPVTPAFFLFPTPPTGSPVYRDTADADHSLQLPAVQAGCQTGAEQCVEKSGM